MYKKSVTLFMLFTWIFHATLSAAFHADGYTIKNKKPIALTLSVSSRLSPSATVFAVARTEGVVQKLHVSEGSFVQKGALLFTLEDSLYKAAYDQAKAQKASAQALLEKTSRDFNRSKALYEDSAINVQAFDAARFAYKSAQAAFDEASAQLNAARTTLNYTKITAPIDAFVHTRLIDVGNVVTSGTQLIKLTTIDPIYAHFSLADEAVKQLRKLEAFKDKPMSAFKGLAVRFTSNETTLHGTVDFASATIDETSNTFGFRARFDNAKHIAPNTFGHIHFDTLRYDEAQLVPQKAVLQNKDQSFVYLHQNSKAVKKVVRILGQKGDDFIIDDTFDIGDTIIVNMLHKIQNQSDVVIDTIINKSSH